MWSHQINFCHILSKMQWLSLKHTNKMLHIETTNTNIPDSQLKSMILLNYIINGMNDTDSISQSQSLFIRFFFASLVTNWQKEQRTTYGINLHEELIPENVFYF